MKRLARIILVGLITSLAVGTACGQGLVNFLNTSTTLISIYLPDGVMPSGAAGSYYFALLTAPSGTTDPRAFRFSGVTGTNVAVAGRFTGGASVSVAGWAAGATKSFEVAGWDARLGVWQDAWLQVNGTGGNWIMGVSAIGTGEAGGFDGTATLPALSIFGAAPSITTGFLLPLPEPTSMALAGLGAAAMLIFRRRK